MTDTAGTKNVTLTETKAPKAKRRSVLSGVKELEQRVESRRVEREEALKALTKAQAAFNSIDDQFRALTDAYALVKPQPRTRKAKS